jgi:hypothetical protein
MIALVVVSLAGCQGIIGDPPSASGDGTPRTPAGKALVADDIPVSGARRLSRAELDNVLFDLLGSTSRLGTAHLPEDDQEREGMFLHWPFDNAYPKQTADKVLVLAFETIADAAAREVVGDEAKRASIVPCAPTGADDAACLRAFVEDFGLRAFRRPLEADEIDNFMRLHAFAVEADDFWLGVRAVLTAMLQSVDFLYRVEIGTPEPGLSDVYRLNDFEIASRMSFLLWGSAPDDALLGAARDGLLGARDGRQAEARRMLEDGRAIAQVDRFHALWLGYNQLPHSPELTTAMREETLALLRRVVFEEDRPYVDIFRSSETYVSPMLAEHYGIPTPEGDAGWVTYDDGRGGILSHGTVLAAFATGGDTSLTRRGVYVRERLMCQTIPPPPLNVNADDIPETNCKSEMMEVHQEGACGGCHRFMDPIGWGLENYDLAGRFRAHDEGKPECVIDGAGSIDGVGEFTGPAELADLLIEDGSLERCAIRQVVRYAIGREERPEDEALVDELVEARAGDGWSFLDLLVDVVASDRFVLARRDESVSE